MQPSPNRLGVGIPFQVVSQAIAVTSVDPNGWVADAAFGGDRLGDGMLPMKDHVSQHRGAECRGRAGG
ncbi:hypothetical protein [Gemmatimonas sp.]|uniref:hypothetical protein n=1 Tax=Gemmatimonas sp. TaxID=1962908 RepID=UPI00333E845C